LTLTAFRRPYFLYRHLFIFIGVDILVKNNKAVNTRVPSFENPASLPSIFECQKSLWQNFSKKICYATPEGKKK